MGDLSATSLLGVWERGSRRPRSERILRLLEAASAGATREDLGRLPVGVCDAHLLTLREAAFGSRLEGVVACPACRTTLELGLNVSDIRVSGEGSAPEEIRRDGYAVRFRLPVANDLAALEAETDPRRARRRLLERCVEEARHESGPVEVDGLPEDLLADVVGAMERADPQANVELALTCPDCGHEWLSPLDVASFLWTELDGWARRTLREVHALASAYGWTEPDVLALSAHRRRLYLEMIGT